MPRALVTIEFLCNIHKLKKNIISILQKSPKPRKAWLPYVSYLIVAIKLINYFAIEPLMMVAAM